MDGGDTGFDYDWLIVGSGFDGSVCAPRLAEKGYTVGVVSAWRRFCEEDLAKTTFDVEHRSRRTPRAVFFGTPDETVPDPCFGGEGPDRTGCIFCGEYLVAPRVQQPEWAGKEERSAWTHCTSLRCPHDDPGHAYIGARGNPARDIFDVIRDLRSCDGPTDARDRRTLVRPRVANGQTAAAR